MAFDLLTSMQRLFAQAETAGDYSGAASLGRAIKDVQQANKAAQPKLTEEQEDLALLADHLTVEEMRQVSAATQTILRLKDVASTRHRKGAKPPLPVAEFEEIDEAAEQRRAYVDQVNDIVTHHKAVDAKTAAEPEIDPIEQGRRKQMLDHIKNWGKKS